MTNTKPLTWAGTDKLRVYLNGKLVDELQGHEVANLMVECARVLQRERLSVIPDHENRKP